MYPQHLIQSLELDWHYTKMFEIKKEGRQAGGLVTTLRLCWVGKSTLQRERVLEALRHSDIKWNGDLFNLISKAAEGHGTTNYT